MLGVLQMLLIVLMAKSSKETRSLKSKWHILVYAPWFFENLISDPSRLHWGGYQILNMKPGLYSKSSMIKCFVYFSFWRVHIEFIPALTKNLLAKRVCIKHLPWYFNYLYIVFICFLILFLINTLLFHFTKNV